MIARRTFTALALSLVLMSAPGSLYAGDPSAPVRLGFVNPHSPAAPPPGTSAFWERLHELGYIEGKSLLVDARWANDQPDRLPGLIADILRAKPDVLVTWGGVAAVAAKNATTSTPVIAVAIPLGTDLPANLARPGGNVTGLSLGYSNIAGKWLELLGEVVPRLSTVAVIANPANPVSRNLIQELRTAAPLQQLQIEVIEVPDLKSLERAFELARGQAQAAVVLPDSVLNTNASRLTGLAAKHRLPTIYSSVNMVDAGGLMAYGPDFRIQWRRAADYVDKILKGAKPSDLPIEEPSEFRLRINLKTAETLGLTIPQAVLVRADDTRR